MDMHPQSNAEQGLACLGSRKKGVSVGNRLLGMARVSLSLLEQMWVPDYESRAHKLLVATECSIVAPGPRCIALEHDMHAWKPCPWDILDKHLRGLGDEQQMMHHHLPIIQPAAAAAAGAEPLDSSVQSCLLRMHHAEMRALALCRGLQTSQTKQQLQHMMTRIAAVCTSQHQLVHNRMRYHCRIVYYRGCASLIYLFILHTHKVLTFVDLWFFLPYTYSNVCCFAIVFLVHAYSHSRHDTLLYDMILYTT